MATNADPGDTPLTPDNAFALLGNETRMDILQTLAGATDALSFSELRDRVGVSDSGQFNYHLDKLEGHFVDKVDGEYALQQAGRRVIEAVLSGAVTEAPVLEPTQLDAPCPYCGADIEVSYQEEAVLLRCTSCTGSFSGTESSSSAFATLPEGTLTMFQLPPAGLQDRPALELLATSLSHTYLEMMAFANGFCPRCTGRVQHSVEICADHAPDGSICSECGGRFEVGFSAQCRNCEYEKTGTIKHLLLGDPEVRSFFEDRGIDTFAPAWEDMEVFYSYKEDVMETDPLNARFVFTIGEEDLVVTIGDDLTVVETSVDTNSKQV